MARLANEAPQSKGSAMCREPLGEYSQVLWRQELRMLQ